MPGEMARSDPRPSFGLPEVVVAVSTSRLSCKRAGETRTLMPVWDSSGESQLKALGRFTSRRSRFHCFDNSLTQVTRQRFRHPGSPHRRINAIDSLTQTA